MSTVRIYKTLTEHTNGRIKDAESPTGWKRQTGTTEERVPGQRRPVIKRLYEPCEAPKVAVYGTADENGEVRHGGTVHTRVEGIEAVAPFTADEIEIVVRRHASRYSSALFVLNGGTSQAFEGNAADAFREAAHCRDRVQALVGVDLDDTNVAFPYRLTKRNRTQPFEFDGEFSTEETVGPAIF